MIRDKTFSTEEVFAAMHFYCGDMIDGHSPKRNTRFYVDGQSYKASSRMRCFFLKGPACCLCKTEGYFFAREKHPPPKYKKSKKKPTWHLNLYAKDNKGRDILMTFDHWIPLGKGGRRRSKTNMATMCSPCNSMKGGLIPIISTREQVKPSKRKAA